MPKHTRKTADVAAQLAERAQLVRPVGELKQIPIIETSVVTLEIPAPYDFIQGQRTLDLPPSLMVGYQQAQAALKAHANVQKEKQLIDQLRSRYTAAQGVLADAALLTAEGAATDAEACAAAEAEVAACEQQLVSLHAAIEAKQQAQIAASLRVYDLLAQILNATIIAWNLTEYARIDGQPFSAPGAITRDDLLNMRESMLKAISGAIMGGDRQAEAERKKGSTAS